MGSLGVNTVVSFTSYTARFLRGIWLFRQLQRRRLLVLCYHGVVEHPQADLAGRFRHSIGVAELRRQLLRLKKYYNPVSIHDVQAAITKQQPLPPFPVLVTFDDGYRNNLQLAVPELERAGVPALFAVTTGHIGKTELLWPQELFERIMIWPSDRLPLPSSSDSVVLPKSEKERVTIAHHVRMKCKSVPDPDRQQYLELLRDIGPLNIDPKYLPVYSFLNWDEVREIARRGFAIASHTVSHPILSRLDLVSLKNELILSKGDIEVNLQLPCDWICYPNGEKDDISQFIFDCAKDAGYRVGFTTIAKLNSIHESPLSLGRFGPERFRFLQN